MNSGKLAVLIAQRHGRGRAQRLGPIDLLSYGAARITTRMPGLGWHRYRLLAVPRKGMPKMPRGFVVRVVSAQGLTGLIDADDQTISYRMAQGMTALAAYRGERLIGVNWISATDFDEDEVSVRWVPPPGGAWDTGLWIEPKHRLSRAFAALWAGTARWMAEHDIDWSFSRIADYNLGSLAPHQRMGGLILGTASFAHFGPFQIAGRGRGRLSSGKPTRIELEIPR